MRKKWILPALILSILLSSLLVIYVVSSQRVPPSGVPASWEHHKVLGRFELWLPEEWEDMNTRPILLRLLEAVSKVVGRDYYLTWFIAVEDHVDNFPQWIEIQEYVSEFKYGAPLIGEEFAKRCCEMNSSMLLTPPPRPGEFEIVDTSDVATIDLDEGQGTIAYQSSVIRWKDVDNYQTRTFACLVSSNHVYWIKLGTVEEGSTSNPTYEMILRTFRVPK